MLKKLFKKLICVKFEATNNCFLMLGDRNKSSRTARKAFLQMINFKIQLKLYYFSALEWCDSLSKAIRLEKQEDAIQAASELLKISKIGSFIKPK